MGLGIRQCWERAIGVARSFHRAFPNTAHTQVPEILWSFESVASAEDLLNNQNRFVGLSFVSVKFYSGVHE